MTVIAMSRTEIDRMSVLQDLPAGRIKVMEAATLMGLGRRQVYRLAKAYHHRGPAALVSRRRVRPRNRSYPADIRAAAIVIIRERYADFGPTPAAETQPMPSIVRYPHQMSIAVYVDRMIRPF
jgi:hypothetical protein